MRKTAFVASAIFLAGAASLLFQPSALRAEEPGAEHSGATLKRNEIVLYEHENFQERGKVIHIVVTDDAEAEVANNLVDHEFNDKLSSIRWNLDPGVVVWLYEHTNGKGRELELRGTGEKASLKADELNDRISSYRWARSE